MLDAPPFRGRRSCDSCTFFKFFFIVCRLTSSLGATTIPTSDHAPVLLEAQRLSDNHRLLCMSVTSILFFIVTVPLGAFASECPGSRASVEPLFSQDSSLSEHLPDCWPGRLCCTSRGGHWNGRCCQQQACTDPARHLCDR